MVSLFSPSRSGPSDLRARSERGLDFRLEHVPYYRAQLAVEPFEQHFTRQLVRPRILIAHPAVALPLEDPLPSVIDEEFKIIQKVNALNKVDTWACP